jgi:hypothetical protein
MTKAIDLNQHFKTGAELAEGQWHDLDFGLRVRLAPMNSPLFFKAYGAMKKKFGSRGKELTPEQAMSVTIGTYARAVFLEYEGEIKLNGKVYPNTLKSREMILETFPDLRDEIARLASVDEDEFVDEADELGKD